MGTAYCTAQQLQDQGANGSPGQLADWIEEGSRLVDAYVIGPLVEAFAASTPQTVVISDVRRPMVALPTPFKNVTQVQLNQNVLDPSTYIVEEWGVRLYSTTPLEFGWPVRGSGVAGGTWPAQASGAPFGAQLQVTATFGYDAIPRLVARAAALLGRDVSEVAGSYEPGQTRLQIGQFTVEFDPNDPFPIDTTGNAEVDRLLRPYRRGQAQVA